jgi:two-component system response regulator VicR
VPYVQQKGKKPLSLTHREFQVLRLLWIHRDKVVTREQLLRSVWGYTEVPLTRTVDQFIVRLRSKIESDPHQPRFLHTVYGDGYRLTHNP